MYTPAEVDVLSEQCHAGIESAEPLPDVAPDEHAGAAHRQGVPVAVVLSLIDLTRLHASDPAACGVDGQAGLDDNVPVRPVPQFRPEHCGSRRLGGTAQELLERVGGGLAVIVQQPEPLDLAAAAAAGHRRAGRLVLQCPAHRGCVTR